MTVELKQYSPREEEHKQISSKDTMNESYANPAFSEGSEKSAEVVPDPNGNVPEFAVVKIEEIDVVFEDLPPPEGFANYIYRARTAVTDFIDVKWTVIKWCIITAILIGFFVYFGFAMHYEFGSEPSVRVLWVTCVVVGCIGLSIMWHYFGDDLSKCCAPCSKNDGKVGRIILWVILALIYVAVVTFILVDVFHLTKKPYNLVSLGGLLTYLFLCYVFSYSPAHVNWRAVLWGIALQFIFALIILRWTWGYNAFQWLGDRVAEFLGHAEAGAEFMFGIKFKDHFFAFAVLPVVVFFSTVISMLYYLGVMQAVIQKVGSVLEFLMGTTAGESLSAAGNIFIGQTEAPLMIRPLLKDMTRSEIHAIMTGGFATIAGSVLAAYILFGVPANHLISASVMSAPAALAISKLFYPETQVSKTKAEDVKAMEPSKERNIIEAASAGASQSVKLVANIAVNLIAAISLLHFVNSTLTWLGHRVGLIPPKHEEFTFEFICSYLLYPLAAVMGTAPEECRVMAELIGVKTFLNEFVAYDRLGKFIKNKEHFNNHMATVNGSHSFSGRDIILYNFTLSVPGKEVEYFPEYVLERGTLLTRTEVIATYALCGFSNFGSMGIMLGALGAMAPSRKPDLASVVFRAMIAGNVACFMTACIAGLFYTGELD